jgi:magnesium transporter
MGKVRQAGADYLFCRLMGVVVDHYVEILEFFREKIDELEDIVLGHPQEKNVKQIARLKKEVNRVRRYIFPLAAEVARLMSDGDPWIQRATHTYLRNIYDHVQTVYAGMENLGDRLKDLMDLHLSRISHDMNRVMKTLTVVTTIFIPLTFLAGIYGMNFRYMPELEQPWGYPVLLLLMLGIAAGMSIWMWRKKWF